MSRNPVTPDEAPNRRFEQWCDRQSIVTLFLLYMVAFWLGVIALVGLVGWLA